jgi:tetratricopeptide (TPR) repeat protein
MARQRQWAAWMMMGLLWAPGAAAQIPRSTDPVTLAQTNPITVTGQLDENSATLSDGSYFNVHTFEGNAGTQIQIDLASNEFDTYLLLIGPDGQVIAQDDDSNGGTNSRVLVTLPTTGTYQILANTYSAGEVGRYTLTWSALIAADVAQSETLQGATVTGRLDENSQVNDGRYFNVHLFEGLAGATIFIELQSNDFDTFLALAGEDGNVVAQNYEWRGRQGSQIITTLPNDGTYQIIVTHYFSEEEAYQTKQTGQYQLTWRSATREDILQAAAHEQAMARAMRLRFEAVELSTDEFCCDEALLLAEEALNIYREQLGNDHPDVADNLLNVGGIYTEQLRFDEAEILLLEAVQIYRENLVDQYFLLTRALNRRN